MPNLNGTGPQGQGPQTGWGRGPCGQGFRQGFGRGCGMRRRFTKKEELVMLGEEEKELEAELLAVKEQLKVLK